MLLLTMDMCITVPTCDKEGINFFNSLKKGNLIPFNTCHMLSVLHVSECHRRWQLLNSSVSAGEVCIRILPTLWGPAAPAAGALVNEFAHTFLFTLVGNFLVPRVEAASRDTVLDRAAGPLAIAVLLMPTVLSPLRSTGPTVNPAVATAWAAMLVFDGLLGGPPAAALASFWGLYAALLLGTFAGVLLAVRLQPTVERAWAAASRRVARRRD